jgi:lipopolysaccharide transport system ATP-binding protein
MASDNIAIRVSHLSKQYRLGGPQESYHTLRDAIVNSLKAPMKVFHKAPPVEGFWALKDVSFDVEPGEVVGIIGRNGAGKSTLLKILSRITTPTEGTVELHGRVGSLLEVGTGFHPELTGRENIYLSGSILGMKRREIDAKLDEIIKFSEIEKFLDTPVKRYSSGMYVRLAFAVAAHLEPEILLVDEVLAVGDAAFQKKCLGKMGDVAKEGRTVLFVSHQMDMVRALCKSGYWLDNGQIRRSGYINEVLESYIGATNILSSGVIFENTPDYNYPLQILSIAIYDENNHLKQQFDVFEKIILNVTYIVRKPLEGSHVKIEIKKSNSILFWSFDTDRYENYLDMRSVGRYHSRIEIPGGLLKPGVYQISAGTGIANLNAIEDITDCLTFEVQLLSKGSTFLSYADKRPGLIVSPLKWETKKDS